ncbi:MAG: hypothetical protein CME71_08550 [Halobacteriovorax sp.]|nr:hypothetical protein [Halobacteriovorax sp.]
MSNPYPLFLKQWDFNNVPKSRDYFLSIENDESLSEIDKLQLKTQIARTYSLERKFDLAHEVLDIIEPSIQKSPIVEVRYLLERGRCFNSNNEKEKANEFFLRAWEVAKENKIDGLAVDAAHMVAIAYTDPEKQLEWNLKAMELAQSSNEERAKQWLGSLYNNLGWTFHDRKEYTKALELFQKALDFRINQKAPESNIRIARWSVARALRSLNRVDEALDIQLMISTAETQDGYNFEEVGELYLLKNDQAKAKEFFKKAYDELSKDSWFVKNEAKRLERLKSF